MILRHLFTPPNNTRLAHLCGPMDEHLRTIEAALQVKIAHRHEQFKVDGTKANAKRGMEMLQALYEMAWSADRWATLVLCGSPEPLATPAAFLISSAAGGVQVSDVCVTTRQIRRAVLGQSLLSFAYNTTIVALALNLVFGLLQ